MFIITYTAFGKELKQYTFLPEDKVKNAISIICPTYHNFVYKKALESDIELLSSPLIILPEKKLILNRREVMRPTRVRKYRAQGFPKKHCYMRTHNITFFEDAVGVVAWHCPELSLLLQ